MASTAWLMLRIASTTIDTMVSLGCLLASGRRGDRSATIHVRRAMWSALAVSAAFALKLPVWYRLGVNGFGVIHLAYLDLCVLLPITGVVVLLCGRAKEGRFLARYVSSPVKALAVAGVAMVPLAVYATYVEPFRLQEESARLQVAAERAGGEPLTMAVVADLQTDAVTSYEHDAIDRVMSWSPDLILIPGDVFHGSPRDWHAQGGALSGLLNKLDAPGGVYMVLGNADWREALEPILHDTPVRLLVNEIVEVHIKDRLVTIGGVDLDFDTKEGRTTIARLEEDPGDGDIRILLAHHPDVVLRLRPQTRIDLVVAGHTHGGQVQLPFFGPPITLSNVPRHVAAGGLHELAGRRIYISRGIGCERRQAPRIRFLCPPEITRILIADDASPQSAPRQ